MQVQGTTAFPDFAVFTSLLTVSSLGFSVSLLGLCKVAVTILKAKMFYERKKKKFSHLKKYIYCKGLYLIVNLNIMGGWGTLQRGWRKNKCQLIHPPSRSPSCELNNQTAFFAVMIGTN